MKRGPGHVRVLAAWMLIAALAPSADAAPRHAKARALERSHVAAASALARARALRAGHGVVTGRELTPALAELSARYEALDPAERREADRLLARPTDGAGDPEVHGYTVPEHAPFCTANLCMHWVTTTDDAPDLTDGDLDDVPDVVEDMAAEFTTARTAENVTLGWQNPISDGARGGNAGKVDVYLAELAGAGLLGYAATDPGQADAHHRFAYMVMDDDYAGQADPVTAMQVTAAHEYNHVLQFGYDAAQDTWMAESTAVWMEDRVHDAADSYLGFIPSWATLHQIPLAKTFATKHYGSSVWNMWLDARYGPDLIRAAWEVSAGASPQSFAPGAYDAALTTGGHDGFAASFVSFAADVAEWRTASAFPEGAAYADAQRRGNLQAGGMQVSPALDHTVYALYTIPQPAGGWPAVLRLDGELPAGVTGGLALVARTGGDPLTGTVTKVVQQLPDGGAGSIQLPNPDGYGRITAVLANADTDTTAFQGGDWVFSADAQPFTAAAGASGGVSEAPVNTAAPTVSGVARDGSQLTAANGAWSGSAPMAYARQWRRCDSDGGACTDIAGATGARYTATEADIGHALRVRVDASNGAGAAGAESGPTAAVAAIPVANQIAPSVSGDAVAGGELVADDGSWTGSAPIMLTRRWQRCASGPMTCADIPGEVGDRYRLGLADVLSQMRVVVRASNAAGALEVPSALSAPVRAAAGGSGPPPPPATTATIKAPRTAKLATALAGKLAVTVECSGACAATLRLELTRATARRLGVAKVPARGSKRLAGAGQARVRLAFSATARRKLRRVRKLTGTLAVKTRDASGTLIASRRGRLTLRR
jgi:hypothetical protein